MPFLEKSYQAFGVHSDSNKKVPNENSDLTSIVRSRCDSLSFVSSETTSTANLENEELLVDFFSVDICSVPSLLLCKRSVGESLDSAELTYLQLPLTINVQTQRILNVFQLKDRRIVLVLSDLVLQQTEIYLEYTSTLNFALSKRCPKICLKDMYNLVGLNFVQNLLAIYSHTGSELVLISLKNEAVEITNSACISTSGLKGEVKRVMFIHGSNELCLVTENGLRTFSLSAQLK